MPKWFEQRASVYPADEDSARGHFYLKLAATLVVEDVCTY